MGIYVGFIFGVVFSSLIMVYYGWWVVFFMMGLLGLLLVVILLLILCEFVCGILDGMSLWCGFFKDDWCVMLGLLVIDCIFIFFVVVSIFMLFVAVIFVNWGVVYLMCLYGLI